MTGQLNKHQTLYFHMGPGFHSKIEAEVFSERFPHITFLNQPLDLTFEELISWTVLEIKKHYSLPGQPLTLLGHSFGGQLIAAALPQVRSMIGEVRLLSSAFDSFDCFANLDATLNPETAQTLSFWKNRAAQEKMDLIFQLAQNPALAPAYWHDLKHLTAYNELASKYPSLCLNSFIKAFSRYLQAPEISPETIWDGKCEIYFSKFDNLIKNESTILPWKRVFPKARFIETEPVGHYGLFESSELANEFLRA